MTHLSAILEETLRAPAPLHSLTVFVRPSDAEAIARVLLGAGLSPRIRVYTFGSVTEWHDETGTERVITYSDLPTVNVGIHDGGLVES